MKNKKAKITRVVALVLTACMILSVVASALVYIA